MAREKKESNSKDEKPVNVTLAKLLASTVQDGRDCKLLTLVELLQPTRDEQGTVLLLEGSLRIKLLGSEWVLTLSRPSERVQASFRCGIDSDPLSELEAFLSSGKAAWEPTYEARQKALTRVPK